MHMPTTITSTNTHTHILRSHFIKCAQSHPLPPPPPSHLTPGQVRKQTLQLPSDLPHPPRNTMRNNYANLNKRPLCARAQRQSALNGDGVGGYLPCGAATHHHTGTLYRLYQQLSPEHTLTRAPPQNTEHGYTHGHGRHAAKRPPPRRRLCTAPRILCTRFPVIIIIVHTAAAECTHCEATNPPTYALSICARVCIKAITTKHTNT